MGERPSVSIVVRQRLPTARKVIGRFAGLVLTHGGFWPVPGSELLWRVRYTVPMDASCCGCGEELDT